MGRPSPARDRESPHRRRASRQESDSREGTRKGSRKEAAPIPNVHNLVHCGAVLEKQACDEVENDKFTIYSGRTGPQGPFERLASVQKGRFFGPPPYGSDRDRRRNRTGFQRSRRSEREVNRRVRAYPGRGRKGRADQSARQVARRDGILG